MLLFPKNCISHLQGEKQSNVLWLYAKLSETSPAISTPKWNQIQTRSQIRQDLAQKKNEELTLQMF